MGYSTNIRTITRVQSVLDKMVSSEADLEIPSPDDQTSPRKLAHQIREAIRASASFAERGEPYRSYALLMEKYKLRERRSVIIAELKDKPLELQVRELHNELIMEDVVDIIGAIGTLIKLKPVKISFPNLEPSNENLERLSAWAEKREYTVEVIDDAIIVRRV